ncbi:MAG: hypothetical protein ACHRHE_18605 [Tepidisphaerales bacterium]
MDWASLRTSSFPWVRRSQIGSITAYLKTAWLITIDSRKLRHEAGKPQLLADARIFQRITASIVAAAFLGTFIAIVIGCGGTEFLGVASPVHMSRQTPHWMQDVAVPWSAGARLLPVACVCLALLTFQLAGVPRYLVRLPHDAASQPERGEAIACYAVGPMVWLGAAALAAAAIGLLGWINDVPLLMDPVLLAIPYAMAGLVLLFGVIRAIQWAVRVRRCGFEGALLTLAKLLGRWLLGLVVFCFVLPWCVGFLFIVADSFF